MTNSKGRIVLTKQTDPPGANFPVYLSYGPQVGNPDGLSMSGGFQVDSSFTFEPGVYIITEAPEPDWSLSIEIVDPTGDSYFSKNTATINLSGGETITVAFDNKQNYS